MQIHKIKQYKGFILVEVIASLLIFSIFAVFSISVLSSFMKGYIKECEIENEDLYVSEGMTILDSLLSKGDIKIENNQIKVIRKDNTQYSIAFDNYAQKIIVNYPNSRGGITPDNVILKVKKFKVLENKNVFYIFITCNDGRRYRRCFILRNSDAQDTA